MAGRCQANVIEDLATDGLVQLLAKTQVPLNGAPKGFDPLVGLEQEVVRLALVQALDEDLDPVE